MRNKEKVSEIKRKCEKEIERMTNKEKERESMRKK